MRTVLTLTLLLLVFGAATALAGVPVRRPCPGCSQQNTWHHFTCPACQAEWMYPAYVDMEQDGKPMPSPCPDGLASGAGTGDTCGEVVEPNFFFCLGCYFQEQY